MRELRIAAAAFAFAALSAAASPAQEAGQIGVSMGYPGAIGVIWHITDSVAIGPDFSFRRTAGTDTTTTSTAVGISGFWYFANDDRLRLYATPRFRYSRSSSEYEFAVAIPSFVTPQELAALGLSIDVRPTFKATASTKSVSGSFGAQYALHKRFSLFGQAGLDYSKSSVPESTFTGGPILPTVTERPHSWGTTTSVGVIIYFKD